MAILVFVYSNSNVDEILGNLFHTLQGKSAQNPHRDWHFKSVACQFMFWICCRFFLLTSLGKSKCTTNLQWNFIVVDIAAKFTTADLKHIDFFKLNLHILHWKFAAANPQQNPHNLVWIYHCGFTYRNAEDFPLWKRISILSGNTPTRNKLNVQIKSQAHFITYTCPAAGHTHTWMHPPPTSLLSAIELQYFFKYPLFDSCWM